MSVSLPHPNTSRANQPHSKPGVSLPIDIFFCIVDEAIANAEDDARVNRGIWAIDSFCTANGLKISPLIRGVEIVALSDLQRLLDMTPRQVQVMLSFPNLRVLTSRARPDLPAPPDPGQIVPIKAGLFTALITWLGNGQWYPGRTLRALAAALGQRGSDHGQSQTPT
ncbi:hypothetical protein CSUB01_02129 [Colletotrichum sublineola]|uniref:Uncharacterized protein n=1 Tax=Colletotrichum sublineola TaxID=1173701 RepID=A0A066XBU0_COLSU|nr:hypothetical protein CSUB01_02129 [Colletotrichum sublineola]